MIRKIDSIHAGHLSIFTGPFAGRSGKRAVEVGIHSIIFIWDSGRKKDPVGSQAYAEDGIVQQAIQKVRAAYPDLVIIADCCFCEYTSHGHCGLVSPEGEILNDPTLSLLAKNSRVTGCSRCRYYCAFRYDGWPRGMIRAALEPGRLYRCGGDGLFSQICVSFLWAFRDAAGSPRLSLVTAKPIRWIQPPVYGRPWRKPNWM